MKKRILQTKLFLNLGALQVLITAFGTAIFMGTDAMQCPQMFCPFGMVPTLERIVTMREEGFSPLEILRFSERLQR